MNRALKFRRRLGAAALFLAAILFLAFYFAFESASETENLSFWMNHTQEVLGLIAKVRLERSRLTNEIWSYRASHNAELPDRFQADVVSLRADTNHLRQLTADNSEQQARANEIEQILGKQIPLLKEAMQRAVSSQSPGATEKLDWSLPTPPSDRMRELFESMDTSERELLNKRAIGLRANMRQTQAVLITAGIFTFVILSTGWYLIQREVVNRAEAEQGMRHTQALLGVKYEEQRGELKHIVEDLHEQIVERQAAEERIKLLNEQLEKKVQERTAELAETNKELETFSYSVSHDLRAPLRHMEGFSKILQQQYGPQLPEEAQHYLTRIREASTHMATLVEDLLHLSRISQQSPQLRKVPLAELVEEAKMDALSEAFERDIHWQIDSLPQVDADPILLRQALTNLFANAVKFTKHQPHALIEIGCLRENGEEVVFVRDNGAGFDPRYADKLFGVFQRLHRQDEFEGTGIGLATVQRIIHKHGGRVWAESQPGQGATFYFSLPAPHKRPQLDKQMIGATA